MKTTDSSIQVWAPSANRVDAVIDDQRVSLQPHATRDAWWTTARQHKHGTRYGFLLDESDAMLPDPRSPWQPDGVFGLSAVVDHSLFGWSDPAWQPPPWEDAVVYEMHIGTFSAEGTFEGAIPHLDTLVRLGITHVEILPVNEFSGRRGWGYDGVFIYAPHHAYGGPDGLKAFVDACHSLGIAVIIDVVYNHMGPEGNVVQRFAPYFTDRNPTPWGGGPDLDGEVAAEVRGFFIDNAMMWLRDYHADGLRLDAIDKVVDTSPRHFLSELAETTRALSAETGKSYVLIAESAANDPIYVTPVAEGGYGMTCQWNDDFHHSLRTLFTGDHESYYMDFGSLEQFAKALRQGFVYDGCHSPFRGRPHGKPPGDLPPSTFLAYLQNHDQIGNRPQGDRFHHHENAGTDAQKVGAAFVLLSPFIPMIFMGEEWAASSPFQFFTDYDSAELREAVKKGRKAEFGGSGWTDEVPDPQAESTYLVSKLRWDERHEGEHSGMLGWYTELIRLRKSRCRGPAEIEADPDGAWLVMKRGNICIAGSFHSKGTTTPLDAPNDSCVLLQAGHPVIAGSGKLSFYGVGVVIYLMEP